MPNTSPTPKHSPQFARASMRPLDADASHTHCDDSCHTDTPQIQEEPTLSAANARYSWKVGGMDCAACARKVENTVRQVANVEHAQVVFATSKLLVDAPSDIRRDVEQAVTAIGYQLHDQNTPATAASSEESWRANLPLILLAVLMAASWAITKFNPTIGDMAFIATTLVGLWPVARQALRLIRSGNLFAIETLMSIAAIGALIIGATAEAAMVLLLFLVGERLEGYAASRARRGVTALMELKPEEATRLKGSQRESVPVGDLRPGDTIEVAAGGRLPADGKLLTDSASFDESALTGESLPVERLRGEKVAAGCTSIDRLVTLEVVSAPGDSAIDRILRLIEEAEEQRAPVERFIDRFSRIYTPVIMLLALLTAVIPPILFGAPWLEWVYKGLTLLLIGCPCALVISTPAAITSGLAAAARHGALIKGGAALERLGKIRQMAFDKTGTLTQGKPQVTRLITTPGMTEETLLANAAAVEQGSTHPLATAILAAAAQRGLALPEVNGQRTLAGRGIEASIGGQTVQLCSPAALPDTMFTPWQERIQQEEYAGQTVVAVQYAGKLAGFIALQDTLRDDAREAIENLRRLGVHGVMLTGDNPRAAAAIAGKLGIDYQAGLLPADKVTAVNSLNQQAPLAMVGDGINDAPAMKAATLGIAMGSGTDVALETADAALTHNRLAGLAQLIMLARATHNNIRQNITIALGLKLVFLVTTLLGLTGLWLAVLADSGATALVTANALRLLRKRNQA